MLAKKGRFKKAHRVTIAIDEDLYNRLKVLPNFSEFAREAIALKLERLQKADHAA